MTVADLASGFCGLSPPLSLKVLKPPTSRASRSPGAMLSEDFAGIEKFNHSIQVNRALCF